MKTRAICWEDLVFEHRFKGYGAYRLRCGYPASVVWAAGIVIFLFLAAMLGPVLFKGKAAVLPPEGRPGVLVNYAALAPPPLIEKIYIPPAPRAETPVVPKKPAAKKYVPPKATRQEIPEPKEVATVAEAKADVGTEAGEESAGTAAVAGTGGRGSAGAGTGDASGPLLIQKDPEFPGGKEKLMTWLRDNLRYPPMAVRMGIEGVVKVSFMVGATGEIANVTVVDPLHRLCDREAIRLISSMPDWIPGEINGTKSTTTYAIAIRFDLT